MDFKEKIDALFIPNSPFVEKIHKHASHFYEENRPFFVSQNISKPAICDEAVNLLYGKTITDHAFTLRIGQLLSENPEEVNKFIYARTKNALRDRYRTEKARSYKNISLEITVTTKDGEAPLFKISDELINDDPGEKHDSFSESITYAKKLADFVQFLHKIRDGKISITGLSSKNALILEGVLAEKIEYLEKSWEETPDIRNPSRYQDSNIVIDLPAARRQKIRRGIEALRKNPGIARELAEVLERKLTAFR